MAAPFWMEDSRKSGDKSFQIGNSRSLSHLKHSFHDLILISELLWKIAKHLKLQRELGREDWSSEEFQSIDIGFSLKYNYLLILVAECR